MKRILFIDDDKGLQDAVVDILDGKFKVISAFTAEKGIETSLTEKPDLILLDVGLPDMDGFEVCKRLREQINTRHIPVVMLTGQTELDARVRGLDLGADDYIGKPFASKELVARINARLREEKRNRVQTKELKVGNLKMNPKSHSVTIDGNAVKLTQLEYDLLHFFLECKDELIPREKLLNELWAGTIVTQRTVDTHIANLRKKIKGFNCSLETVYKAGYILKTK